jgi:nitronate monooxygenase
MISIGNYRQRNSMLRTRFTDLLGIKYPIVSAPMATTADGALVAAVSAAGGLGLVGASSSSSSPERPQWLRDQIQHIRSVTDKPFGIGLALNFPQSDELLAVALEAKVPAIAVSFGDPAPYVERIKSSGAIMLSQVQTVAQARHAAAIGVDVLAAQGVEGGGHIGEIGVLTLLPAVLDAVSVPVLAAGGIGDGRGLAAVLLMGGDGAWMGTRFVASAEAGADDWYKNSIVEAETDNTVRTLSYDLARGVPFPNGIAGRVIRNAFTDEWHARDEEIRARREELAAEFDAALTSRTPELSAMWAGSVSGLIKSIEPAGDLVQSIASEAEAILSSRPGEVCVREAQ